MSVPYLSQTLLWRAYCDICKKVVWRWHRHTDIYP